jgi:mannose-6-phosphate isomerase-like protein (cupin superfamily)
MIFTNDADVFMTAEKTAQPVGTGFHEPAKAKISAIIHGAHVKVRGSGLTKGAPIMKKISLSDKFSLFSEYWSPKIVAELNGQHVKIVKVQGSFDWHQHPGEDELFWVIRGELDIEFRDQVVRLGPGEMLVVPRGVEHRPVAEQEVQMVLFEPAGTLNTGDKVSEKTVTVPDRI